jgi:hypothetical protein
MAIEQINHQPLMITASLIVFARFLHSHKKKYTKRPGRRSNRRQLVPVTGPGQPRESDAMEAYMHHESGPDSARTAV